MKTVLFYISGHGYGHSTRMIEVMKNLLKLDPGVKLIVRTDAPRWLYDLALPEGSYEYSSLKIDVGVVQKDSFTLEKRETLLKYASLIRGKDKLIKEEVRVLRGREVKLVVGDIPPLAFDIAREAEVPSIAIGNFSWDWIYEAFIDEYPQFNYLINDIRTSYSKADLLLRLPLHGEMSAFKRVQDIPLIARQGEGDRQEVLTTLGLGEKQRVVLLALRPADMERINFQRIEKLDGYLFLTFDKITARNLFHIPKGQIPFPDLVRASDIVVSKPGYGIVSECIANRTPLLYTSRDDFREYKVLAEYLERSTPSVFIPRDEFFRGDWGEYLEAVKAWESGWTSIPTNGGEEAAKEIIIALSRQRLPPL